MVGELHGWWRTPRGLWETFNIKLRANFADKQVSQEWTIKGSAVGNQREVLEVLDMAARGIVKTRTRIEKMENLTEVFKEMSEGKMLGRVILDLQ